MPSERDAVIDAFLAASPAAGFRRAPLAGDASQRRYERLTGPAGGSFVLMDAAPGAPEDIRRFVRIADWLRHAGFSAPEILDAEDSAGLLLLEDLGDRQFFAEVQRNRATEIELYAAATDLLAGLQDVAPPGGLTLFDARTMTEVAVLPWRWYGFGAAGHPHAGESDFSATFAGILSTHAGPVGGAALRDFHAQNLIWLPERTGHARVGLLDFQDAVRAPAVYDLVSLLTDARRDVPPDLAAEMTDRFIARRGLDPAATRAAAAVVGLQRNLRILGVFARLSLQFGKAAYVDLIPRVWSYIQADLAHPANAPVRPLVLRDLPPPDPALLKDLKTRCGTIPTP